ncbi:hypothetical protein NUW58_g4466 [Xylaria curta]|uniref:Uncharacterized protein n=1 Tax=Xylaria curta TaxID=42375 RepID=A0ACC1P7E7_9PEZI|nr:hypothetical protein NUW58_g4466 [Xylaria curta]
MGVQFFSNWELWQQLTFVLAAGIVLVFFIGWAKLFWMQRLLKKHALLDEEKRVRQMELRKSGLPVGRRADIPFGVRAIQSGIEVEGIWISRPATPMEVRNSSKASSTTLDIDGEPRPEDKGKAVVGSSARPTATVTEVEPTPKPSPGISPIRSYFDRSIRQDITGAPSPGPQTIYSQSYSLQRPSNDSGHAIRQSQVMTRPEGIVTHQHIETYVPTSSSSTANSSPSPRVRPSGDRMSVSSEEGLSFSSPRYPADVRGKSAGPSVHYRSPFEDTESPSSAGPSRSQGRYCSRVRAETSGNPFDSPGTDRAPSPGPQTISRPSLASTRPTPVRTYADQRENTSSRVVNSGFEVLPAGTFSRPLNDTSPGLAK